MLSEDCKINTNIEYRQQMSEKKKRITMKLRTPNPLFEKWITEWRDKAKEENSKMEFCFNKALASLKKYPLPMESGRDCKILKGFGDRICHMLDNKLKEYKRNPCNELEDTIIGNYHKDCENENENKPTRKRKLSKNTAENTTKRRSSKEYSPKEGSGGYAILVTLYRKGLEPAYPGYLTKMELIREGQHLADMSFVKPVPGSRYTAWSSMANLISKKLVEKKSNPAKFSLTDDGLLLARRLYDKGKSTDSCNNELSPSNLYDNPSHGIHLHDSVLIDLVNDKIMAKDNSSDSITFSSKSSEAISLETKQEENNENIFVSQIQTFQNQASSKSMDGNLLNTVTSKVQVSSTLTSSSKGFVSSLASNSEENLVVSYSQNCKTIQKHASSSSVASSTQSSLQEDTVIFLPDTFDIILYVDTCETGGSNVDIRDDPILAELRRSAVPYEIKNLKVGDYAWICRDRDTKNELILPYIVERKRMDDFGHSIKDGRYHEQKFRLKKSGIQNIIYLIERYGNNQHVGLPIATLYQAATNTAVQDDFCIKFTESYKDTAKFLAHFLSLLSRMFKSKTLVSCPKESLPEVPLNDDLIPLMTFKEFNKSSSKNKPLRVSDLFVKMLIQIKGMSVDRALAIVQEYPTPSVLRKAYENSSEAKGEKLLAQIQFGDSKKTIGPVLSKTIHQLFTTQSF